MNGSEYDNKRTLIALIEFVVVVVVVIVVEPTEGIALIGHHAVSGPGSRGGDVVEGERISAG